MHAHAFDPYIPSQSLFHSIDARIKLLLVLAFITGVALVPPGSWAALVLFFATLQAAILLAFLPPGRILRRSSVAVPFALAALPLIFTTSGTALTVMHVGPWYLTPTWEGISRFVSIAAKSWISVQAALLLSATTPFPDLLLAMRALRFPQLLVAIIGLMWRYLFVLVDEAIRLIRAREARSGIAEGRRAGGGVVWRAGVAGGMAGSLFIRGFDRADRIYAAMLSRGYDGEIRALPPPVVPRNAWFVLGAGWIWILVLSAIGLLFH